MKTMSAIYQKVRHRLNDDWAYGNDIDARPWDFQAEECALRESIEKFNSRRYDKNKNGDFAPVDNCLQSVLGQRVDLPEDFHYSYEMWLKKVTSQMEDEREKWSKVEEHRRTNRRHTLHTHLTLTCAYDYCEHMDVTGKNRGSS